MIVEIVSWTLVGAYVVSAFYTSVENLTGRHVRTRGFASVVRIALEAVIWPLAVLPWRELPSYFRREWQKAQIRYSEVPS